jgi:N utilization substance protein A
VDLDLAALRAVADSQHLPVSHVITVVEEALTDAYQRTSGADPDTTVIADEQDGTFVLHRPDGQTTPPPAAFGRIAVATARQAIVQWMRDQERRRAVGPWAEREGAVVRATVVRYIPARGKTGAETQLRVSGVDAVLPDGEAIAGEQLAAGQQLDVLLLAANVDGRGRTRLTVSRRQPALVSALLTERCPAVADGRVIITAVARDPGARTKVAIRAGSDGGLAPTALTALTVGPAGQHVRAVADALNGEKIDIVVHHDDLAGFVAAALTPGTVERCTVTDQVRHQVAVSVRTDQLALVAGRGSANVRLAQRLTGARIELTTAPA